MDERLKQFQIRVGQVIDHLHKEYAKLQTGRASAALVEHVMVEAYGQKQELRVIAGISVSDVRTLVIQPWDRSIMRAVETALSQVDLGTSPVNDGVVIRINLPPMTEERRKEMVKVVHRLAEEARISVRQQRQEVHDAVKAGEKDEDVRYTSLEEIERIVGEANDKVEEVKKAKEKEVMTV